MESIRPMRGQWRACATTSSKHLLKWMSTEARTPPSLHSSLTTRLRKCNVEEGMRLHITLIKQGNHHHLQDNTLLTNSMMTMYSKSKTKNLREIMLLLESLKSPDECSFNIAISSYAKQGMPNHALKVFSLMNTKYHTKPNEYTLTTTLQACNSKEVIMSIHQVGIKLGLLGDLALGNALLSMYSKYDMIDSSIQLFHEMAATNVVSWTSIIVGYIHLGLPLHALQFFANMDVIPNNHTLAAVLSASTASGTYINGWQLHALVVKIGSCSDPFVKTALVDMYAKCGNINDARQVFVEMCLNKGIRNSSIPCWNAMISGYSQRGMVKEAMKMFSEMPGRDEKSWTAMVNGYAKEGMVEDALSLFKKSPRRDAYSWTALISGFVRSGHWENAIVCFREMVLDIEAEEKWYLGYVLPSVLSACSALADVRYGLQIHCQVLVSDVSDEFVDNSLLDMYSKSGSLDKARKVFNKMRQRDIASWNTMISAYGVHGIGHGSLEVFNKMVEEGVRPDEITFVNVLSACNHAGLVEEGCEMFSSMLENYDIKPTAEHFNCMVDLLGRAGRVEAALDIISKSPRGINNWVWASLLNACRMHNKPELAQHIADIVLEKGYQCHELDDSASDRDSAAALLEVKG